VLQTATPETQAMTSEHAFRYEHCDIPSGMTLREWRAAHAQPAPRSLRDRLRRR
jgi:hypothetical protein